MSVSLRPWHQTDAERLAFLANDESIASNMTDAFPHPYLIGQAFSFLQEVSLEPLPLRLAILSDGWLAGGIGIHPKTDIYRLSAELGYWLGKDYRGFGIGTEAIRLMVQYTFTNLSVNRIFATPFPHNIASQRALEKNGFFLEARFQNNLIKNGVVMDELVYALRRL
ncbi:MAG: hypothetical protein RLZZ46_272 [Bacteroidota bacterium]|jgi:RimJ/RimL family protein N-acetyltransferase